MDGYPIELFKNVDVVYCPITDTLDIIRGGSNLATLKIDGEADINHITASACAKLDKGCARRNQ